MSRNGPSGRGVISGSHAPQSAWRRRATALTSAVLPIPGSPVIDHDAAVTGLDRGVQDAELGLAFEQLGQR